MKLPQYQPYIKSKFDPFSQSVVIVLVFCQSDRLKVTTVVECRTTNVDNNMVLGVHVKAIHEQYVAKQVCSLSTGCKRLYSGTLSIILSMLTCNASMLPVQCLLHSLPWLISMLIFGTNSKADADRNVISLSDCTKTKQSRECTVNFAQMKGQGKTNKLRKFVVVVTLVKRKPHMPDSLCHYRVRIMG